LARQQFLGGHGFHSLLKKSAGRTSGLKPESKQTTYRSGKPLRHPKTQFFSKLFSRVVEAW
jgi:hypothetical protein